MTGRDPLEKDLAALHAIRDAPRTPEALSLLKKVLAGKRSYAVAAAAEIVGESGLRELLPLLPDAFSRFVDRGADTDRNCRAKLAIAVALQKLDWDDADFFLRGIRIQQWEPVWGGSVDTAADLRGTCAIGLSALYDPRVLPAIVELLVDSEWVARASAARALGGTGRAEAEALLRYKALVGDPEPQVMTEVFSSLLTLAPGASLDFVAGFLRTSEPPREHGRVRAVTAAQPSGPRCTACGAPESFAGGESVAEAAALALGQSRRDDALPVLLAWSEALGPSEQRVPLLAIAMLRTTPGIDHLVALVEKAPIAIATHAVAALALHRYDDALRARAQSAVSTRRSKPLSEAFAKAFARE